MAEYGDYQTSAQGTYSRYSQHNDAASTQSWVQPPQRFSSIPPPQPINLPTPVQTVRPLPIPGNFGNRPTSIHSTAPLRVVNKDPPTAQIDHFLQRNILESDSGTATSAIPRTRKLWSSSSSGVRPRPQKKKSFVGGFFKGVKKLPRTVFGYGAGMGTLEKSKLKYGETSVTEGTTTSEMTGSFLPAYSSNPSSPVVRVPGPRRSRMNVQRMGNMFSTEPTILESPLPDVVRLDDQRHSIIPSVRVTPPSGNYDDNANLYGGTDYPDYHDNPGSEPSATIPGDRTTFMVYNDRPSYFHEHTLPAPTTNLPRQTSISPPALSYVDSQHPASLHSSAAASTVREARPPNETTQAIAPDPGGRVSFVSPSPQHPASYGMPSGTFQVSSPPTVQSLPLAQMATLNQTNQPADVDAPPPQTIGSPQSVHPEPTDDYRKMSMSPSPTSHDTYTSATSYYDPSFSSLNRIERFFKMLYHMPWVSHDRVTVDYHPGDGASKGRKRKTRPMSSWYHGILAHSRRSSTSLDLLSSGTPSAASPGTSLRASLAMAMSSPGSHRSARHRHSADRQKVRHHRSRQHQGTSHHRHRRHDSRRRKRDTATSMGTTNTDANWNPKKPTSSPLIPHVYPYSYPPYPYPAFSAFPMPAPAPGPIASQASQSGSQRLASPRGPRSASHQPVVYAAPATYSPYQPMMSAPQVFLLQPTPPANIPASLVPGSGHDTHVHGQSSQPKGENSQRQPTPGVQGAAQNIPGAF